MLSIHIVANIRENLTSQIGQNNVDDDYKRYLTSHTAENLQLHCITGNYTTNVMGKLGNENSSDHGGISITY